MNRATRDKMVSSESVEWGTPKDFFAEINEHFRFGLDVCARRWNAKLPIYYSLENGDDGLALPWGPSNGPAFCNPPYGRKPLPLWAKKAVLEKMAGNASVLLVPGRFETAWYRLLFDNAAKEIRIPYRLAFEQENDDPEEREGALFPSVLLYLTPHINMPCQTSYWPDKRG